jgi:hypothetical protein
MSSGKVFKDGLFLSDVRYTLAEEHHYQDVSGLTTTSDPMHTTMKYVLRINAASPAIPVAPYDLLTLRMEDGYRLDFYWWPDGAHATNGKYKGDRPK